jgi:hypothetical protein
MLVSCSGSTTTSPTSTALSVTGTSNILVGGNSQLTATATLSTGLPSNVTAQASWSSSNSVVATVSNSGFVTAVGLGSATITATYQNQTGTLTVIVSPATANSPTTYSYAGTTFTTFTSGYTCPSECQVHASFTTPVTLSGSLASASFTMWSFTFSDGHTTITEANGSVSRAIVSTNANGDIVPPWAIEVQTSTPAGIVEVWTINQPPDQGGASDGSDLVGGAPASAYNTSEPGTWTSPQPASAAPGFSDVRRPAVATPARR